jgi:hypothetical protein
MSEVPSPKAAPRPFISAGGLLVFFLGIALVTGTFFFGFQWFISKTSGDLVNRASSAFQSIFKIAPHTTISSGSVIMEKAAIAEMAVTQRKMHTVVNYKQAWLGSQKIMVVEGDFVVKAGFDLNHKFRFSVDETTREVLVEFPRPKILSVDFKKMDVVYSSDGLINKLTPNDTVQVIQQLNLETRAQAAQSDILQEAMQQMEQRVRDLLGASASKVTVRFQDAAPPPVSTPRG